MTLTIWPHDLVDDRYFYFSPWEWSLGTDWHPLERNIPDWVPDTTLHLRCEISYQFENIVSSAGLDAFDSIRVVSLADCSATGERELHSVALSSQENSSPIVLTLAAGRFRGRVSLENHLVMDLGAIRHPIGTRLLSSPESHQIILSENSDRFPVEAFSFRELGFDNIDWRIEFEEAGDESLWNLPFQAAVRLWINTDRFAGHCVLNRSHVLHDVFRTVLEREIILAILGRIERDEKFGVEVLLEKTESGSIGLAVQSMAANQFHLSPRELLELSSQERATFVQLLQKVVPFSEPKMGV